MTPYEREILIRTVLGEAANQGPQGWAAVAHVIRNRTRDPRWPGEPDEVVLQPKQFSAWNPEGQGGNHLVRKYGPDDPLFQRVGHVVDQVMGGDMPDPTGGATHYYAPAGMPGGREPHWFDEVTAERGTGPVRIGDHVFTGKVAGEGDQFVPRSAMPGRRSPVHPDIQHGLVPPSSAPSEFMPASDSTSETAGFDWGRFGGLLQALGGSRKAEQDEARQAEALLAERDLAEAAQRRRNWHQGFTWL